MREPMSRELAEATRRLDRALEQLEAACAAKVSTVIGLPDDAYVALESDRARLAADLEAARFREEALAAAAAAASQALGRAAAEVRAALGEDDNATKPDGGGLNEEAA